MRLRTQHLTPQPWPQVPDNTDGSTAHTHVLARTHTRASPHPKRRVQQEATLSSGGMRTQTQHCNNRDDCGRVCVAYRTDSPQKPEGPSSGHSVWVCLYTLARNYNGTIKLSLMCPKLREGPEGDDRTPLFQCTAEGQGCLSCWWWESYFLGSLDAH